MTWASYVYVLDSDGYPNNYTTNELNSIVQTAQQDIKKDYPDQEDAWKDDGNIEARYTLDDFYHQALPVTEVPDGKLKHDNEVSRDLEPEVHDRLIIAHWDEDVEQFTVMIIISNTEPLIDHREPIGFVEMSVYDKVSFSEMAGV